MKEFFSYYEILEVGETAKPEEIKRAYREKALQYHPDRVAEHLKKRSEEIFKQISEAYEVLSDPVKRKQYDEELKILRGGQSFEQSGYAENPILQVNKTRFEFKDVKWGSVVTDFFLVSNEGNGRLMGTVKSVYGWVVLSKTIIDTGYSQGINITVDTHVLLANRQYRDEIDIETNGGRETVYVDVSVAHLSNVDAIISLARSIVTGQRIKVPLIFCGIVVGLWILGDGLVSYYKSSIPAVNSSNQINATGDSVSFSGEAMNHPPAPPPAPPRRFILEFQPVIVVHSGYGFPAMPGRRFYGGRVCRTGGRRH